MPIIPFIPLIASVAGPALAGLLGGGKQSTNQSSQQQTGTSSQTSQNQSTGTSTPNLSPFQQQLSQMFSQGAMDQFNKGTNLAPYTSQGLQGIAGQGQQNNKMISNIMAQRGLSYSPAAATGLTQNALNTGNQMQSFQQGIPLLQRNLQQENLSKLMEAFKTMPVGATTSQTGMTNQTGTNTGVGTGSSSVFGNPAAGAVGGGMAGFMAPGGIFDMFTKPKKVGVGDDWQG